MHSTLRGGQVHDNLLLKIVPPFTVRSSLAQPRIEHDLLERMAKAKQDAVQDSGSGLQLLLFFRHGVIPTVCGLCEQKLSKSFSLKFVLSQIRSLAKLFSLKIVLSRNSSLSKQFSLKAVLSQNRSLSKQSLSKSVSLKTILSQNPSLSK